MKIDTHVHTNYSDGLMSIDDLRKLSLKKEIIPCITDHNTIKGALAYQKKFGKNSCIIGEEIKTQQGEVIGLYMKKEISGFLDLFETMRLLKKQKAVIIIPHPFDRLRGSKLRYDINRLNDKYKIDFIEVFNSRTMYDADNQKARDFFEKNRKKQKYFSIVGSDAHMSIEFGRSYCVVPEFDITKKAQFLDIFKNPKKITFITHKSPIIVHAITKTIKILKGKNKR